MISMLVHERMLVAASLAAAQTAAQRDPTVLRRRKSRLEINCILFSYRLLWMPVTGSTSQTNLVLHLVAFNFNLD